MDRIYMDHAATTPVRPEVIEAMLPAYKETFGNASSVYSWGREAQKALDDARAKTAAVLGAEFNEIIFTGGGSEADNLAIKGTAWKNRHKGKHIITSAVEHHAVLDTVKWLETQGFEATFLSVDEDGMLDPQQVRDAIREDTILITVMHGNNEMGSIMPVEEIADIAREKGVLFHTDAVQTVGSLPIDVKEMGMDMLSLSAHKFYGPKGVGALYVRKGVRLDSLIHGGAQERNRRAGTEDVPAIIGLAEALERADEERDKVIPEITRLRDRLLKGLETIPETRVNGHRKKRLPNNVNVCFRYIEGESLLLNLDMMGIAASSGSACTSGSLEPSHVLLAMGLSHEIAHGSLRLTLGRETTENEVDYVLEQVPAVVNRLREMSPLYHE